MSSPKASQPQKLERTLKPRHLNMIAIGGAIGTGLFVALGDSLSTAGPGGALLAYAIIGAMVYFLMTSLGEMTTFMPVAGAFETYGSRFVDPAFGFALGWNYWYNWSITVAAELVAAVILVRFWFPDAPAIFISIGFLALLFLLNFFSAKIYGESEFWFASIKVFTVIIFLVLGLLMILGIMGGSSPGLENWTVGDAPFVNGAFGVLSIFMVAGFSFQGTEMISVAAGESENPQKAIPKAIRSVFWRILLFYIGAIAVIGFLIPYTDPNLLKGGIDNLSVSPFTLVFQRAGLAAAASVMNAVILSSVLSAGNSGLYVASRMLYALAKDNKAPKCFAKLSKHHIPLNALLATTAVACASFLSSPSGEGPVYVWLVSASGLAGFITWVGIAISHYRFRKALLAQGHDLGELAYKAKWYPFGPLFALCLCLIVIAGQGLNSISAGHIDWMGLVFSYIGIPIFLALYFGYKIKHKTKLVKPEEADLSGSYQEELALEDRQPE